MSARRLDPAAVLFAATLVIAGACASIVAIEACTPAQDATWASIEKTVLADIENGSALTVIEAAVVAIDPAAGTVVGLVDQIIVEAIQLLEDTGALPVDAGTSVAEAIKGQAMAKMGEAKADAALLRSRQ